MAADKSPYNAVGPNMIPWLIYFKYVIVRSIGSVYYVVHVCELIMSSPILSQTPEIEAEE